MTETKNTDRFARLIAKTTLLTLGLLGFSPESSADPIALAVGKTATNALRLTWNSQTGKVYRVIGAPSLLTTWTNISSVTATLAQAETFVFPSGPQGFFKVQRDTPVGGDVFLRSGQTLSGVVAIDTIALTTTGSNVVTGLRLLDVYNGRTNLLGSIDDRLPSESVRFMVDTSFLQSGDHMLQVQTTDDNGPENTADQANIEYSDPVSVHIANPIYFPDYKAPDVNWKLTISFGTTVPEGTWQVDVYDDTGSFAGTAKGDLATRDANGLITIEDGYAYQNWYYNDYSTEYFDVVISVTPSAAAAAAGSPAPAGPTKYVRKRVKHRAQQRTYVVAEDPRLLAADGTRTLMDAMMDTAYAGLATLGYPFDLQTMAINTSGGIPGGEGWNMLGSTQMFANLNYALAYATNAQYRNPVQITDMFSVTHGWGNGIGYTNGGIGNHVTDATLQLLGYWSCSNVTMVITSPPNGGTIKATLYSRPHALTFAFLDGCNTMDGSIVNTLVDGKTDYGGNAKMSLSDLISGGYFPHYGCGWTRAKAFTTTIRYDVDFGHADYVGQFFQFVLTPDPSTGLPANTYKQSRAQARYWSNTPGTINPYSGGWDFTGCEDLYIDE